MDKGQPTTDIAYYQSKDNARSMEIQGRCIPTYSAFEYAVELRQRSLFSMNQSEGRQTAEGYLTFTQKSLYTHRAIDRVDYH